MDWLERATMESNYRYAERHPVGGHGDWVSIMMMVVPLSGVAGVMSAAMGLV